MSDTKSLRELAEDVLSSKPDFCGGNWRTHYDYEKAANPQAILALIDELEKMKTIIRDFAWHYDDCAAITISENEECSCGLWDELKSVGLEGYA